MLLVLEDRKLIGIISERDFSRKANMPDKPLQDLLVKEIMTSKVVYVNPDYTTEDCKALVTEMRSRHLPALETDQIVGIVSIGDLVKDAISDRKFVIDQPERYIYETR
ncbi:MAG: CBS domain-containing protein [Betaproteobacteria bacterium]|nr:CBS domain-containing protein [Betaproteobacteria bacterium]